MVQSTKTAPKLPVATKTPLKQASDSTKLAPKAKKPLIKAEVASKVDDALEVKKNYLTKEEMGMTNKQLLEKANNLENEARSIGEGTRGAIPLVGEAKRIKQYLGKVDDALPVGEKMGNTTQSAKSLDKIDDGLIAEARKKYLINGREHTLENIKASGVYKSIIESLNNLGVKGWTDDDIIAMLKKTQKPNTTNADRNRAITEIENKYPRNIKPGKDDLPF